jgi:hypothetical protein
MRLGGEVGDTVVMERTAVGHANAFRMQLTRMQVRILEDTRYKIPYKKTTLSRLREIPVLKLKILFCNVECALHGISEFSSEKPRGSLSFAIFLK